MKNRKRLFVLLSTGILILIFVKVFINSQFKRYDLDKKIKVELPENYKTSEVRKLCNKADELSSNGEIDKAIGLYREALKIDQNNTTILFDLANCYSQKDDLTNTLFTLDEAIALDSANPAFYSNRGLAYYKMRNTKKAISDYKAAIRLDSNNYVYFANLALAYNLEENHLSACEALQIAKKLGLDLSNDKVIQEINYKCE